MAVRWGAGEGLLTAAFIVSRPFKRCVGMRSSPVAAFQSQASTYWGIKSPVYASRTQSPPKLARGWHQDRFVTSGRAPGATSMMASAGKALPGFVSDSRGFQYHHFEDCISSTQDEMKQVIEQELLSNKKEGEEEEDITTPDVLMVSTSEQSHGRGTNQRNWTSVKGNTFVSVAFPMDALMVPYTLLPLQVGNIVASVVKKRLMDAKYYDATHNKNNDVTEEGSVSLKWPNDVLVDQKKIAGVLIETVSTSTIPIIYYFVVGIGVNVAEAPLVPNSGAHRGRESTCLANYIPVNVDTDALDVALDIAGNLSTWLRECSILGNDMKDVMEDNIVSPWRAWAASNMGRRIEIRDAQTSEFVTPIAIEPDGQLLVKFSNGKIGLLSMTDYLL
jgi:biotin-(acetyl-CoA carboxylase) ligase